MKEKITFEEMIAAGVDKNILKKLEPEYPEKEMELKFNTLNRFIGVGVNPRLLIPLISEDSAGEYIDDLDIAYFEWVDKEIAAQREFAAHPITMKEGAAHRLRMQDAWENFADTNYSTEEGPWKAFQKALSDSMELFDLFTGVPMTGYILRSGEARDLRVRIQASIVADAAVGS